MFIPDLDLFPKERFTAVIYGSAGAGKAQPLDEPVLTLDYLIEMGGLYAY